MAKLTFNKEHNNTYSIRDDSLENFGLIFFNRRIGEYLLDVFMAEVVYDGKSLFEIAKKIESLNKEMKSEIE